MEAKTVLSDLCPSFFFLSFLFFCEDLKSKRQKNVRGGNFIMLIPGYSCSKLEACFHAECGLMIDAFEKALHSVLITKNVNRCGT